MLKGLTPTMGAGDMDWSSKLSGHNPQERASALIYTLDV